MGGRLERCNGMGSEEAAWIGVLYVSVMQWLVINILVSDGLSLAHITLESLQHSSPRIQGPLH